MNQGREQERPKKSLLAFSFFILVIKSHHQGRKRSLYRDISPTPRLWTTDRRKPRSYTWKRHPRVFLLKSLDYEDSTHRRICACENLHASDVWIHNHIYIYSHTYLSTYILYILYIYTYIRVYTRRGTSSHTLSELKQKTMNKRKELRRGANQSNYDIKKKESSRRGFMLVLARTARPYRILQRIRRFSSYLFSSGCRSLLQHHTETREIRRGTHTYHMRGL